MKKIICTLLAIVISTLAFSPGPTTQKVQESVTIAASPKKTWEALKNYSEFEKIMKVRSFKDKLMNCLLYTSPSPRDGLLSRMPSSA
mgnify:CR=1 FL=1